MRLDAGAFDDLEEQRGRCVEQGFLSLAIFRQGGEVFALENACPHRGGPLCEGDVRDGIVYCPLHAWGFDLRSGKATNVPRTQAVTFPARVEAGRVVVEVGESTLSRPEDT